MRHIVMRPRSYFFPYFYHSFAFVMHSGDGQAKTFISFSAGVLFSYVRIFRIIFFISFISFIFFFISARLMAI
ncbi:hypothetical protein RC52_01535 [Herbaspirillum rubrisubalbicans]|nr:hypothetical protein [Herbaspirillum rubrisubalbicans]